MAANLISCFPIIPEKCFEAMGLLLTKRQLQQHCLSNAPFNTCHRCQAKTSSLLLYILCLIIVYFTWKYFMPIFILFSFHSNENHCNCLGPNKLQSIKWVNNISLKWIPQRCWPRKAEMLWMEGKEEVEGGEHSVQGEKEDVEGERGATEKGVEQVQRQRQLQR